jgi:uncharacterized membrane protein YgaE (UPF0421/DUF939 family)
MFQIEVKQAIKTALAAVLSLFLCIELDLVIPRPQILISGLWCVVASIVVLQTYVGGTYKAMANRFLGVLIGSITGALFVYLLGGSALVLGLAIFTTVALCSLLNLKEGYRIAGLSVAVIIIPWMQHPELSPWLFALFRFFDTCLGILVAMLVAHTIWPSEASLKLRMNIAQILDLMHQFARSIFILSSDHLDKKNKAEAALSEEIERLLIQTRLILDESKLEKIMNPFPLGIWIEIIHRLEEIFQDLYAIKNTFKEDLEDIFDQELRQEVDQTIEKIDASFKTLIAQITDWHFHPEMENLNTVYENLNSQLIRFRTTKTTRKYSFEFVERYFVFFYSLKSILQNLEHLNDHLSLIQNEPDKTVH